MPEPDFSSTFGWLLHDAPITNPVTDRLVSIVVGDTVSGGSPTTIPLPFYLPPPSHPSPEAFLWRTSSALLELDREHELQQRHCFQEFWAAFQPHLRHWLGNDARLAEHKLQHLGRFLCSSADIETMVGGSASTGTVLGR